MLKSTLIPRYTFTRCTRTRRATSARGFTLLELIIAVTILASFILPMLLVLSKAKVRTTVMTQKRELRDLAYRKLLDHVHYYDENNEGDFTEDGRAEWTWEILEPEPVSQSDQPLLQYTIRVHTPQKLSDNSEYGEDGSVYELTVWTFPDRQWFDEQAILFEQGGDSILYGNTAGRSY